MAGLILDRWRNYLTTVLLMDLGIFVGCSCYLLAGGYQVFLTSCSKPTYKPFIAKRFVGHSLDFLVLLQFQFSWVFQTWFITYFLKEIAVECTYAIPEAVSASVVLCSSQLMSVFLSAIGSAAAVQKLQLYLITKSRDSMLLILFLVYLQEVLEFPWF